MSGKKIALVLSGGAFNGAFQMGVLQYMHDHWDELFPGRDKLKFDIITGVSVGALNGALVASDRFPELLNLWDRVKTNGVQEIFTSNYIDTKSTADTLQFKIRIAWWRKFLLVIWPPYRNRFFKQFKSLADNAPLKDKLKTITKDSIKTEFRCGLVTMNDDAQYYAISPKDCKTDKDFQNAILASSAMPIIWAPVRQLTKADGTVIKNILDGGVRTVAPLGEAIDFIKADSTSDYLVLIVNCCNGKVDPVAPTSLDNANIAEIALRTAVLTSQNEIINDDVNWFLKINDILDQIRQQEIKHKIKIDIYNFDRHDGRSGTDKLREFTYKIVEPDQLVMGDELTATPQLITRRIEHGMEKAALAFGSGPVTW